MSDSEDVSVSDAQIQNALKKEITRLFKIGDHDEITVKRIRAAAEWQLGLSDGYLKTGSWKDRSKEFIGDEVARQDEQQNQSASDDEVLAKPKPKPNPKQSAKATSTTAKEPKRSMKRPSPSTKAKPQKKRKVAASDSEEIEDGLSASKEEDSQDAAIADRSPEGSPEKDESKPADMGSDSELSDVKDELQLKNKKPKTTLSAKPKGAVKDSEDGLSDVKDEPPPKKKPKNSAPAKPKGAVIDFEDGLSDVPSVGPSKSVSAKAESAAVDSESELSDVLDESPPKKKGKKGASTGSSKTEKPAKGTKTAAQAKGDIDPIDAEIKRLQGWLIKCGIRKLWWKELQPYETPKAKINHLKAMLKDAGMDGRYSLEKARQIFERREMEADLEAVQEGAKRWGQEEESEEDVGSRKTGGKLRKGLAKGFKDLDFSDDGVETD